MVDVHTHLFPRWVRENREEFSKRDPVFREIYGSEKARMVTGDEMITAMDENDVSLSIVFGFPWADQGINRDHNDEVLRAASKFPDRLIPFVCLNPMASGAEQETARCIENGAKGVGEN
jgi:predicted TIM-barrel fold metal-dependent hydrolase